VLAHGNGPVLLLAAEHYDSWAGEFLPIDVSDPTGDFDGDGMTNDEERLFGLDPTDGNSVNPIASGLDATAGTLSYTRRNPALSGATYTYQWSTTLAGDDWSTFIPQQELSDGGDPVETVFITLDSGLLTNPALFVRVVATEP
jgi:hypothetical protein